MNIPTPADPVMEMARKIVDGVFPSGAPLSVYDDYLRIALAAIRATTEAAAVLIDQCNREGPYEALGAAALIRANHHIQRI